MNDQPDGPHHDDTDEVAELPTERWIYGGIRALEGKRVYAWIDPSGRELLYAHKRGGGWAIGSYYTAQISRDATTTRLHGLPTYTGDATDDDALRRDLWASHTAAQARLADLTRERNAARRNAIDEALQPLIAAARSLKTSAERDAFTAYVLRHLISSWATRAPSR
jgi:hypothetical protein